MVHWSWKTISKTTDKINVTFNLPKEALDLLQHPQLLNMAKIAVDQGRDFWVFLTQDLYHQGIGAHVSHAVPFSSDEEQILWSKPDPCRQDRYTSRVCSIVDILRQRK